MSKIIKIDIDEDALGILKDTEERIRQDDPDRRVNYSAAIRELKKGGKENAAK